MTNLLNFEQTLGTILPDAFITRITLENSAFGDFEEANPHIDTLREPNTFVDPRTGKIKRKHITPGFKNNTQNMKTTLDIVLKERITKNFISTWFGNQNFSKYLRIKIFQVKDPHLTSLISDDPVILKELDNRRNNIGPTRSTSIIVPEQRKLVEIKVLNVLNDVLNDNSNITQQYTEFDNNGDKIISYTFRTSFVIKDNEPEFLSYFVFSYIDIEQLAQDFKFKLNFNAPIETVGKITGERVIENGKVVSTSRAFFETDGITPWVGTLTEISANEFVGIRKNGEKIKLVVKELSNYKVQDFRNFEHLDKLILNFSIIDNEYSRLQYLTTKFSKTKFEENNGYVSDIYLSSDEKGQARFLFFLDYKKLIRRNSIFGNLYKTDSIFNEVVNDSAIASLKMIRKRIKGSPEVGGTPDPTRQFSDNQVNEVVVYSGEKKGFAFVEQNKEKFSIREITDTNTLNNRSIRCFTGIDKSVSELTDGYYKYILEVSIIDPGITFAYKLLRRLNAAKLLLKTYADMILNNAAINYSFTLERCSLVFVRKMFETYGTDLNAPWTKSINEYFDILKTLFESETDLNLEDLKIDFLTFVHPATGNLTGINRVIELMEQLENSLSMTIGLNGYIPTQGETENNNATASKISSNKQFRAKIFTITKEFSSVFNSNIDPRHSFDFLDVEKLIDRQNGLKVISGEEFEKRVEKETDKYFNKQNDTTPNVNIVFGDQVYTKSDTIDTTKFSYLTPVAINVNSQRTVRIGSSPNPIIGKDMYSSLDSNIVAAKQSNGSTLSVSKGVGSTLGAPANTFVPNVRNAANALGIDVKGGTNKHVADVRLSFGNIRVSQNIDSIVEDTTQCQIKELGTEGAKVMFQIINDAIFDKNSQGTSNNIVGFNKNKNIVEHFDIKNPNNTLNKLVKDKSLISAEGFYHGEKHNTTLEQTVSRLPNQLKALFISSINPSTVKNNIFDKKTNINAPETKTEFRMDYQTINTILVFQGFETDTTGVEFVYKPIWRPLTGDIFNNAIGKTLLCRMKPYENTVLNIKRSLTHELLTIDDIFIIEPKTRVVVQENKPKTPDVKDILSGKVKVEVDQVDIDRRTTVQQNTSNPTVSQQGARTVPRGQGGTGRGNMTETNNNIFSTKVDYIGSITFQQTPQPTTNNNTSANVVGGGTVSVGNSGPKTNI